MRFSRLPYKHKIAFTWEKEYSDIPSTFYTSNNDPDIGLWIAKNKFTRKRWIDDFDWIDFLNECNR